MVPDAGKGFMPFCRSKKTNRNKSYREVSFGLTLGAVSRNFCSQHEMRLPQEAGIPHQKTSMGYRNVQHRYFKDYCMSYVFYLEFGKIPSQSEIL